MEILADGCSHKLVIQQVVVEDEGTYSIQVGEHTSEAKLLVEGETDEGVKHLHVSAQSVWYQRFDIQSNLISRRCITCCSSSSQPLSETL